VMGDAHCSLNPIYGQGMTMAALHAVTLRDCLYGGGSELARRYFAGTAHTIEQVWTRNQAHERAAPAAGTRSMHARMRSRIVKGAVIAAAKDTAVAERLLRVAHLIDPPERVNDPKLLPRIVAANARHHYSRCARRS